MAENAEGQAREVNPARLGPIENKRPPADSDGEKPDLSNARTLTPFQIIQRGEDSLDSDERVTFADFSPTVVPADTPEEEILPKGESVPGPAPSSGSTKTSEPVKSEKAAPTPAGEGDGKRSPSESSKQTSSSGPKTG